MGVLCIGANVIIVRRSVAPQINHKKPATEASLPVAVCFLRGAMGDRVYAEVIRRAEEVRVFEDLGFGEQEYWKELTVGVSFLVDEEANYGYSSSLRELAERGCVFIGRHDARGDYDAARLVSDGETFSEVDAMVHELRPCVAVNANGLVDKKQLQAVKRHWRAVARARQKLGFVDEEM